MEQRELSLCKGDAGNTKHIYLSGLAETRTDPQVSTDRLRWSQTLLQLAFEPCDLLTETSDRSLLLFLCLDPHQAAVAKVIWLPLPSFTWNIIYHPPLRWPVYFDFLMFVSCPHNFIKQKGALSYFFSHLIEIIRVRVGFLNLLWQHNGKLKWTFLVAHIILQVCL